MTNLEALTAISPFSVNPLLFEKTLEDRGINANGLYNSELASEIEVCAALIARVVYYQPDTSEGSLSVRYDRGAIREFANKIFRKNKMFDNLIIKNKIQFI